jgi:spore germination protein YaaH
MRAGLTACILALLGTGAALAAPAAEAATCPTPRGLKATAISAKGSAPTRVRLTWRAPKGATSGLRYRVRRGSAVVGQTGRRSMVINVRAGRRVTLSVGVVGAGGRAPRCYAARKLSAKVTGATRPAGLGAPRDLLIAEVSDTSARLSWRAVTRAVAYRVTRDGKTVGQSRARTLRVKLAPSRSYTFTVAAVARGGKASAKRAKITVRSGHRAPGAPTHLAVGSVTSSSFGVSWRPARASSAPIRGYRIFRDDAVVGQTAATKAAIGRLTALRDYRVSVAAVDTKGYLGARATVHASTNPPEPTTGTAHAFVLASTDSSFRDFQDRYRQIGTVYPTYYDCSATDPASIVGRDDALITTFAKQRRVRVMPRFNCQRAAVFRQIFASSAISESVIDQLVDMTNRFDYDGINLDFEAGAPADRDALSAFVADLAGALHRAGRTLSIDVSPKTSDVANHPRSTFFDYAALSQYADTVFVMSWGLHWTTSAPGPVADMRWLTQVASYVASMRRRERFVLGMPLYAMDWPAGGGPAHPATPLSLPEAMALARNHGASPTLDPLSDEWHFAYTDAAGTAHDVWFLDAGALERRIDLATSRGMGGVGFWRLGQEDQALWNSQRLGGLGL